MALIEGALLNNRELARQLEGLPDNLRNKALRQGLRDTMKPVLDDARANAREFSPRLARTIKLRALRLKRRGSVGVKVETGTREELNIPPTDRYYWPAALELGTRFIEPRAYMRRALAKSEPTTLDRLAKHVRVRVEGVISGEIRRGLRGTTR